MTSASSSPSSSPSSNGASSSVSSWAWAEGNPTPNPALKSKALKSRTLKSGILKSEAGRTDPQPQVRTRPLTEQTAIRESQPQPRRSVAEVQGSTARPEPPNRPPEPPPRPEPTPRPCPQPARATAPKARLCGRFCALFAESLPQESPSPACLTSENHNRARRFKPNRADRRGSAGLGESQRPAQHLPQ